MGAIPGSGPQLKPAGGAVVDMVVFDDFFKGIALA